MTTPPNTPLNIPYIGHLPAGKLNLITDVMGVEVGHCTLADGAIQTGVTVIKPHSGNLFCAKVPAAVSVINGFGKSIGLLQIDELGVLETPIALTNTFSVAALATAQIRQAIAENPEIGRQLSTVNPLVFECNDGYLNDIQKMVITDQHYQSACQNATAHFGQGAIGAGRGMSNFGLKGGVGSASRVATLTNQHTYQVGALVLSNFGLACNLTVKGVSLGNLITERLTQHTHEIPVPSVEKGSIIMIIATDAPLDARQLKRLATRASAGLAKTGSVFGHGSGDIALAFSSAYTLPHDINAPMPSITLLHDGLLDPLFQATADAVEQAIINAIWHASDVTGRDAHYRLALCSLLPDWADFIR